MKHYAENHAEMRLGIDNILQTQCLSFGEARKTGSNGFPAGSGGFPARQGGFRRSSGGFPTGSNRYYCSAGQPSGRGGQGWPPRKTVDAAAMGLAPRSAQANVS